MSTSEELSKAYSGLFGEQVVVKRGGKGKNVIILAKQRSKRDPTEKQMAPWSNPAPVFVTCPQPGIFIPPPCKSQTPPACL